MKYNFDVKVVNKQVALDMVKKYHYSNTLPKINKVFLGFFMNDEIVGLVTLGYGTRPLHTIKKNISNIRCKKLFRNRKNVYDRRYA